jgi:hypothetical protein
MNLTVKTLKGGKFTIEVDPSSSVAQVKTVIVSWYGWFLGGIHSVALMGCCHDCISDVVVGWQAVAVRMMF